MSFDFAVLDVNLPDGLGTDLLKEKRFAPDTAVIIVTAHGGVAGAVESMRLGAADYLVKPFETEELPLVLERARRSRQSVRAEEHRRSDRAQEGFWFGEALKPLEAHSRRLSPSDARMSGPLPPVLIQGETGTGKTVLARWLHEHSPRAAAELIEVNCSALPDTLAESELFGHERGAFTDARTTRMGLFEAAQGGTLFLDELPSLTPASQAKVLTAIEDHKSVGWVGTSPYRWMPGSLRRRSAICGRWSGRGLSARIFTIGSTSFRIVIPPLRERGEDIVKLADWLMRRLTQAPAEPTDGSQRPRGRACFPITGRATCENWRTNWNARWSSRRARNCAWRTCRVVSPPPRRMREGPEWLKAGYAFPEPGFSLEESMNRFIQLALAQSDGNVSAAARLLGVPRDFVRYRLGLKSRKAGWELETSLP
jgi:two-component system, NtrC family, response regulator AtoC